MLNRLLYITSIAPACLLNYFFAFGLFITAPAQATDATDFGWKGLGLKKGVFSLAFDPNNSNTVYAGTTDSGLYRSLDEGQSWEHLWGENGSQVRAIVVGKESKTIFIGVALGPEPGIWTSIDNGETWRKIDTGLGVRYIQTLVMHPTNEQVLYAGTGWGVVKTEDGGQTWIHASEGLAEETGDFPWVHDIVFDPMNLETMYALTNSAMLHRPVPASKSIVKQLNQSEPPESVLTSVQVKPNVYKTQNGGSLWAPLETDLDLASLHPVTLMVDPNDSETLYLSTVRKFYKSTNGGKTFEPSSIDIANRGIISKMLIVSPDSQQIYASTFSRGLLRSSNKGETWTQIFSGSTNRGSDTISTFLFFPSDHNRIYYGGHNAFDLFSKTFIRERISQDFNEDNVVNFDDFLLFAQHFNHDVDGVVIESLFDLNKNGKVDFSDFLIFSKSFSINN